MSATFSQLLAALRGGVIEEDLSRQMKAMVEACQINGGKGKITVELTFEPRGSENREMYVSAKHKVAMPSNPDLAEPSIYFAVRGDLVKNDPQQPQLELDKRRREREEAQAFGGTPLSSGAH